MTSFISCAKILGHVFHWGLVLMIAEICQIENQLIVAQWPQVIVAVYTCFVTPAMAQSQGWIKIIVLFY